MKELIQMLSLFEYTENKNIYIDIAKGKYDINIGYIERVKRIIKKLKSKYGRL